MRKVRIISQIVFFTAFAFFIFSLNSYPEAYKIDSDIFLKLNPLSTILVSIASHSFITDMVIFSGAILLLTMIFGRFFCGAVCPLGSMIDIIDTLCSKIRQSERRPPHHFHRIKYVLLFILIILAFFGVLCPLFFDPISLATRYFTFIIDPLLKVLVNDSQHTIASVMPKAGSYLYQSFPVKVTLFTGTALSLLLFIVIFAGTFWDRRFWCQYICPSGAFFGLAGNFPIFKRKVVVDKCNSCTKCARACPTRAIPQKDTHRTSTSECIVCGICTELKDTCTSFSFSKNDSSQSITPDIKRRHILGSIAGGLLVLPVYKATASKKRDDHGKLIRPPGAIPEEQFVSQCIACGSCMKACPTNALQPCMFTEGFSKLYTPRIIPKIGGCEGQCTLCGNVCPTGAIRKLNPPEKPYVKIGTAVVDKNKCVAWEQNKDCVVCDEVCPFNAIDSLELETTGGKFKVPVVKEDLCMGCGMCEHHCPVNDNAAITVLRFGENRKAAGTYMTDLQKSKMDENRKKTGLESNSQTQADNTNDNNGGLPVGFE